MEGGSGLGRGGSTGPSDSAEYFTSNYRVGMTLGISSFGKVKIAEHALTGLKVAIKILNRGKSEQWTWKRKVGITRDVPWTVDGFLLLLVHNVSENFRRPVFVVRREIKILRLLMHPHIIRLYEVIETPTDIFLVMQYMKSGSLFDYIVKKGRLLEEEARRFFQQIVSGVEYCHRNMVVHRDLKPENFFLDSKCNVKIAYFRLSNIMRDGHFLKTSCGTANYAAPEVLSGKLYAGPEVDVWSCGVILYALLCGSFPFDDENTPNLFKKIKGGIYPLPSHLSPGARDLISRMLLVDPMKRVTISEIRQHSWFQAHLPQYLDVPPPDSIQQAKWMEIDEDILEEVARMGVDRYQLCDSLRNNLPNKATVAYHLIVDHRRVNF
ncbi:hypothetical protein R1sor_025428 [Riccia sorocarpa]|uniref:non-specific serine/threonine protein kinase n=1 Tax=Riccia sorocarpa TaxID=122646 RepID=A0ABD3G8L5_9MARC